MPPKFPPMPPGQNPMDDLFGPPPMPGAPEMPEMLEAPEAPEMADLGGEESPAEEALGMEEDSSYDPALGGMSQTARSSVPESPLDDLFGPDPVMEAAPMGTSPFSPPTSPSAPAPMSTPPGMAPSTATPFQKKARPTPSQFLRY